MRYKFIINQNAGSGKVKKNIPLILNSLKNNFKDFDYIITSDLNETSKTILNFNDFDAFIAVGGDGTLNNLVNSMIDHNKIIGMIPFGTGNDYPLMVNISNDLEESIQIIKNGKISEVDVGRIKTNKFEKYFINAVGIGFDAKVGFITNKMRNLNIGKSKYFVALFAALLTYKTHRINIFLENNFYKTENIFLFTIGIGRKTGGAFLLTPNASIFDELFDLCVVKNLSKFKVLKYFPLVLKGNHTNLSEVEMLQSKNIKIKSENPLFVHFDGETFNELNEVEISNNSKKIRFISNI